VTSLARDGAACGSGAGTFRTVSVVRRSLHYRRNRLEGARTSRPQISTSS